MFGKYPTITELKKAIREGRESEGYYSRNPYGPPPNFTNAEWSRWSIKMNEAFHRGMSTALKEQPK